FMHASSLRCPVRVNSYGQMFLHFRVGDARLESCAECPRRHRANYRNCNSPKRESERELDKTWHQFRHRITAIPYRQTDSRLILRMANSLFQTAQSSPL